MEFVRDRGALFWNILFPTLLVVGFAAVFSNGEESVFRVGLVGHGAPPAQLAGLEGVEFIRYEGEGAESLEIILNRLRRHQIDMVVDLERSEYYLNTEASSAPILRRLVAAPLSPAGDSELIAGAAEHGSNPPAGALGFTERQIAGEPVRYVDWVVPGVLGMNMMFSCLFGVGYVLVRYRKNGVLKRLKATPVSALTFVSAQGASRLVIALTTSVFVYLATNAFLGFMMNGSYLTLLLVTMLAVVCMISIGLIVSGRLKSEELAEGMINLVTFPMIILSGVFFSLEGTPQILQTLALALPLTHFITAARAIMLDGAGLLQVMPHVATLAVMSVVFLFTSAALFRWE